jgi:transposase
MPPGHLAYLVHDLVSELDLSAIHRHYAGERRGAPPFDPKMMVSILVYAWCNAVHSSRQIAMLCVADLGGRYLAAGYQPDFRTLSDFRLVHGDALANLFEQSVHLCEKAGMVSLGHVALDGTKIAANASKHKAMSYGRMAEAEERLKAEIADYQRRCAEADAAEDSLFGPDEPGPKLPEELKRRETRLARLREAKAALEAEALAAAKAKAAERAAKEAKKGGLLPGPKPKDPQEAKPEDKAQRNFTDPESRIMKSASGAYIQGYNGQAAVDSDKQVIVACDLTDQAADAPHYPSMIEQVAKNTGGIPAEQSADAGYFSQANLQSQTNPFVTVLIPPDKLKHGTAPLDNVPPPDIPDDLLNLADRMRRQLSTPEGRKAYARRKKTVEPVFGQIKGCPGSPGFTQFLRRGLKKARQEWHWTCAAHNFKKYMRHKLAPVAAASGS